MTKPTLIVMAKTPRVGQGKQRLAAEIGAEEAWRVNCELQAQTLREAVDPRWRTLLFVTPDEDIDAVLPEWPREVERIAQGEGDLGERLARALTPHEQVAVIGADCPLISRKHIASAFDALARSPFALGPSEDGGFWLLAARGGAQAARAMAGVRWSSEHAADDVLRNLDGDVALLTTLYDVDTVEGMRRWRGA